MICTHNRCSLLQRVVRSILAAEIPTGVTVGLFIVANGCSDGTEALLKKWEHDSSYFGKLSFRWMPVKELGKSIALNQSLPEVQAPIVAFVDDDHRIHHQYICAIHEAVTEYPDTNIFCGRILPDWDAREPLWVHDTGRYRIFPLPVPRYDLGDQGGPLDENASTPGGGNLFMRSSITDKIGKFKSDLGPVGHNLGGAEDIEWVRRAISMGELLRYAPNAIQYHYVDTQRLTIRYLMKKAYERTSSTIRVRTDDGEPSKIPMYTLRKSFVYGVKALLSVSASRRRYFLVRTAAALGEIDGFRKRINNS